MTLRKIAFDNSTRYASKDDQSPSEQTPPISKERKKNVSKNKLSRKIKNSIEI